MTSTRKERLEGSVSVNTKVNHPEEDPRLRHKKTFFYEPNEGKVTFYMFASILRQR